MTASGQAGDRRCDSDRGRRVLPVVTHRDEAKPEQFLGAVNPEKRLAASRASIELGRDGGREAQPTAWAATVGHDRPFHSEPERPVYLAAASLPDRWSGHR